MGVCVWRGGGVIYFPSSCFCKPQDIQGKNFKMLLWGTSPAFFLPSAILFSLCLEQKKGSFGYFLFVCFCFNKSLTLSPKVSFFSFSVFWSFPKVTNLMKTFFWEAVIFSHAFFQRVSKKKT